MHSESTDQVIRLFNNALFLGLGGQEKQAGFSGSNKHIVQGHTEYSPKYLALRAFNKAEQSFLWQSNDSAKSSVIFVGCSG